MHERAGFFLHPFFSTFFPLQPSLPRKSRRGTWLQRVVGGQYGRKGSLSGRARVVGVGPRVGRNSSIPAKLDTGGQQLAPDGQKLAGPAGDPLFLLSSSCPFSTPLIHLDPFDQAELHHNAHLLLFEYRISERWSPTFFLPQSCIRYKRGQKLS